MGIERRDAALHGCLESLPDSYFHCIAANLKAQTSQGQRTAFHEIASETVQEGDAGFQPLHLFLALGEWGRLCLAQSGHHPGGGGRTGFGSGCCEVVGKSLSSLASESSIALRATPCSNT